MVYESITQLAISAVPPLIHDLNNDVFSRIPTVHTPQDNLEQYVQLWITMYNGSKDR
jgi:hypothetical protein